MFTELQGKEFLYDFIIFNSFFQCTNNIFFAYISAVIIYTINFTVFSIIQTGLYEKEYRVIGRMRVGFVFALLFAGELLFLNPMHSILRIHKIFFLAPPYYLLLFYFINSRIAKLNPKYSVMSARNGYLFLLCEFVVFDLILVFCCYTISNQAELAYNLFFISNMLLVLFSLIALLIYVPYIKRRKMWFENYSVISEHSVGCELAKSFFYYLLLYAASYSLMRIAIGMSSIIEICLIFFFLLLLWLNILRNEYNHEKMQHYRMSNERKNILIESFVSTIDQFRTLKHDMYNMMQVYNGFFEIRDYDRLKAYHQKVYGAISQSGANLEIYEMLPLNPAFYSVIIEKIDSASRNGISINIACAADASKLELSEISTSKILGILLDNAIEETIKTEKKIIYFSTKLHTGKFLLSITNPTVSDIDTKQIFSKGFTTKEKHDGLGLHELWNICNNTNGCHMNVAYGDKAITFYVELPYS